MGEQILCGKHHDFASMGKRYSFPQESKHQPRIRLLDHVLTEEVNHEQEADR